MYFSQSPRLIEVDPQLIKFNAANPRRHRGTELLRLKNSIEKVGMVQFPTVRELYAGFLECVDGEGRVLVAQENHEKRIWVVCLGKLHDSEALMLLQAANTVRSFGVLDECQGLANLHRQKETVRSLADKFRTEKTKMAHMVDIGYFPEDLLTLIRNDVIQSEEHGQRWTYRILCELLPLRQILPGKDPFNAWQHGQTLDDIYDYQEVHLAVEKILRGELSDSWNDIHAYVAQRRLELFEARFDRTLKEQLEVERAQARQALEVDYSQKLQKVLQETIKEYEEKVKSLQDELRDTEACYQAAINKTAKQSDLVKQLQNDLQQKKVDLERKRRELEYAQQKIEAEAVNNENKFQEEKNKKVEGEISHYREEIDQEYNQAKSELEKRYTQKEHELELQTENTMHQIVANCTRLLTESQICVLNLISPEICKGIVWLQHPEVMALVAQIRTVRETLECAEEQLLHGEIVAETERRPYDGSQAHH
jgi:hypothetical protein